MNDNYTLACFEYEADQPLKKVANYIDKPSKNDIERFVVDSLDKNADGKLTQEDLDFITYNLDKSGVARHNEQYCFSLVKNERNNNKEIWVFNSLDLEAENPNWFSSISIFDTKEDAFECMENSITDDINNGLVEEDGYGGVKDDIYWEARSNDGRFIHMVYRTYITKKHNCM